MKKRLRLLVPLAVIAVAVAVWFLLRPGAGAPAARLTASGTVEATEADLGFQRPGRIDEISVREGQTVEPGQELARLDTRDLEAGRAAARAALDAAMARLAELEEGARPQERAQARAAVDAARRRAEDARLDAQRARRLFEGGAVSRQALDKAETALEVAEAARRQAEEALALVEEGPRRETLEAQRAIVDQARARLEQAEAALDHAVVRAPFRGLVTVRHREPGEVVAAGAPVLTVLDTSDRWVRIYVREDAIGRVRIGAEATIRSDTWPDRAYSGEVVFVGDQAEFTPRNVQTTEERTKLVYPVKVRISGDPDFELKPGIPADVTLNGAAS